MPPKVEPYTGAGLLSLVQWLSPAFPTGAYAYSHGLEFEIAAGRVTSGPDLTAWLDCVLTYGAGMQDAILMVHALDPDADIAMLASLARALAPSAERLAETLEQGAAFVRATSAITGRDLAPVALPVAVGQAAQSLGLAKAQVAAIIWRRRSVRNWRI